MSLREKQKEKRFQAIINAAIELIKAKGYAATSIEEIAEKAEVGVGTVYNYFHNKPEIIVEMYRRDVEVALSNGTKLLDSTNHDYQQITVQLLLTYIDGYYSKREKPLLRELYSVIMGEQALARQALIKADSQLIEQLAGVLVEAQSKGYLRKDIEPSEAAYILFSIATYDFMLFVTDEHFKFAELKETIKRHIDYVFKGLSS